MSQPISADPRPEPLPPADGPALPMPSWPQGVDLPEDLTQIVARWQRAESDLQAQTVLLRTVLDESPDFIILKDHEGNFLLCNRPVAQFYGTTPEAMVGKHDGDFGCPPEMAEAFRRSVLEVMAHGRTEVVLEESRDAGSGETRWFRSIKKPFAGPDGRMRILVIAHDSRMSSRHSCASRPANAAFSTPWRRGETASGTGTLLLAGSPSAAAGVRCSAMRPTN